jgi:hypothetical protein
VALLAWSGESTEHIPPETLEAARFDEGVARIYPRLKGACVLAFTSCARLSAGFNLCVLCIYLTVSHLTVPVGVLHFALPASV